MKTYLLTSLIVTFVTLTTAHAQPADLCKMPLAELQAKAAKSEPAAMIELGARLQMGTGLPVDFKAANELFLKAGDLGDGRGYINLGHNYMVGNGVTKDIAKAIELYHRDGALGNGIGYCYLGQNYEFGIGVTKDIKKAREFYEKAANLGNTDAQQALKALDAGK